MKSKIFIGFILFLLTITSFSAFPILPPGIYLFCSINETFLAEKNINATTGHILLISKDKYPEVYVAIRSWGIEDLRYNRYVNDTRFYSLNNYCKEDITPIFDLVKNGSLANYYRCEIFPYSEKKEESIWKSGYRPERIDNWVMNCYVEDYSFLREQLSRDLTVLGTILFGLILIALFILLTEKRKKKGH